VRAPLEDLRELFKDKRIYFHICKVKKLGVASDRSILRVQVEVLDDLTEVSREIIAVMTWDAVGTDSGEYEFPSTDDLVLVAQTEGNSDAAYVIKRLSSKADRIPQKATEGHKVSKARSGKKYYIASNAGIHICKSDNDGTEPLVLGNTLKTALGNLIDKINEMIDKITGSPLTISSSPGMPSIIYPQLVTDLNAVKSDLNTLKGTYVTTASTNIVSQIAFTERGN
jgi:hypothetical protein